MNQNHATLAVCRRRKKSARHRSDGPTLWDLRFVQVVAHRSSRSTASPSACKSFLASFRLTLMRVVRGAVDSLVDVHVGRIVRGRALGVDRPVFSLSRSRAPKTFGMYLAYHPISDLKPLVRVVRDTGIEVGFTWNAVVHALSSGNAL